MKIFAHRGASGEHPENTLLAFEHAIQQGSDAIEFDVLQVENEFRIFHDRYLDKVGIPNKFVQAQTNAYLDKIALPENQGIPYLQASLDTIAARCLVNIEIKQLDAIEDFCNLVASSIESGVYQQEQFLISSFDHVLLKAIRKRLPKINIGALLASIPLSFADIEKELNPISIHFDLDVVNADIVKQTQEEGYKVYVFTVDRAEDLALMQTWGVDGVFTNYPARSRRIIEELSD